MIEKLSSGKIMRSHNIGTVFTRAFIFLLGLILLLPAGNKLYTYCSYRFLGEAVYGSIDHPSSERDMGGRPIITYQDTRGTVYEFKTKAKTHWFYRPTRGEKIEVFYKKKDPTKVIVNSLFFYLFLPLLFISAGCCCCFYALFTSSSLSLRNQV